VRLATNLQHAALPNDITERPFARTEPLVVGLDCEWTKNYRLPGQSRLFCYSLVFVPRPTGAVPLGQALTRVGFRSLYLDPHDEIGRILEQLDRDLRDILEPGNVLVGHQLCTDLAVADANSGGSLSGVVAARAAWRDRRIDPVVFDTRFDLDGHLGTGPSRRLVDVCEHAGLGVYQPELRGSSLTAMHGRFLATADDAVYERVAVMNLRHSLSCVALALAGLGLAILEPLNLNLVLRDHLWDRIPYVDSPEFDELVNPPC
jgi:hypothetical protein